MANIANRSPWVVSVSGKPPQKFNRKSLAQAYMDELGNPKARMKQLETAFEVQIKLRDKEGNIITRSSTLSTQKEAEKWARDEENAIKEFREKNGGFSHSYETMTVKEALNKCYEEHYKLMASRTEVKYRIPCIVKHLGEHTLLRSLNLKTMLNFRKKLQADDYSASSIRNFFAIISATLKHARSEWLFPIENVAKGIKLEKPRNMKNRSFEGNEEERLFTSIDKRSPWLRPIVELSLEMSFRRGELAQPSLRQRNDGFIGGLQWEGINFEKGTLTLFKEKNDWKKSASEQLGRTVPMTRRMREILLKLHEESTKKTGLVFPDATVSSVTHAFSECCNSAVPPIKDMTFHSCRKIATYNLSKKVRNPILLGKLTGHRDIRTLADRYFKAPIEDLQAMLEEANSTTLEGRAVFILKKELGVENTLQFLTIVKQAKNLEDIISGKSTNEV